MMSLIKEIRRNQMVNLKNQQNKNKDHNWTTMDSTWEENPIADKTTEQPAQISSVMATAYDGARGEQCFD